MLIVSFDNREFEHHFGDLLPPLGILESKTVATVYADCDELDYILRTFRNLPSYQASSMMWYGDMAKFILRGLIIKQWR